MTKPNLNLLREPSSLLTRDVKNTLSGIVDALTHGPAWVGVLGTRRPAGLPAYFDRKTFSGNRPLARRVLMKRVIVALKMPRRMHDYIYQARFIVECLAADAIYAGSFPPLDVVEAHLDALEEATVAAYTKKRGLVQARGAAHSFVRSDMNALGNFVQRLAAFDPEGGPAIVTNAGMSVKNATGPLKAGFMVKQARTSGGARMIAKAERTRASYEWEYSLDGNTWLRVEPTVKARKDVSGLVPGRLYFFRYRRVTKAGIGAWSQVVSLFVV